MSTFVASHRNARISAQKVRLVADLVRGQFADEALDTLKFQPQRGARMLEKVIQSAVANAQDPEQTGGRPYTIDELVLSDVRVDGGPMFRRMRPRARGSAHIIKKRSSHISVKVTPVDEILESPS
ncbi:MAG: 50S ribosomal protein L22 [Planctomycetota bacterium]